MPKDGEIFVDGRRIGLAKEFHSSSVVSGVAGFHLVEFHWRRFSVENHVVVPPQTTVPIRQDLAVSAPGLAAIDPLAWSASSTVTDKLFVVLKLPQTVAAAKHCFLSFGPTLS